MTIKIWFHDKLAKAKEFVEPTRPSWTEQQPIEPAEPDPINDIPEDLLAEWQRLQDEEQRLRQQVIQLSPNKITRSTAMRNVWEVLKQKEDDILRLRKELTILRASVSLLVEPEDGTYQEYLARNPQGEDLSGIAQ